MPRFQFRTNTSFYVNGWLVDLILIEHWSQRQGGAKFHGIRTALGVLKHFTKTLLKGEPETIEPGQAQRALTALWRLSEFGYYIPPEVFEQ